MKSENTKDKGGVCAGYRKQIADMVEEIESQKFLRRILISLLEYLKENQE